MNYCPKCYGPVGSDGYSHPPDERAEIMEVAGIMAERDEAQGLYEIANEAIHESNRALCDAMPGWGPMDGHPMEGIIPLRDQRDAARAEAEAWKGHVERLLAAIAANVVGKDYGCGECAPDNDGGEERTWRCAVHAARLALSKPVCEDGTGRKPEEER